MGRPVRIVKDVLWALALIGAVAILFRLLYGLGPTTNLTDTLPWGLWKILNMVAGVALATGGFTVGLLVYVLGIERLRPLVKPAILIAFLGYGSSVFALLLDIGLPHRIWHPFLMWNPSSFLFEVAMCVAFYFATTIVEMTPTVAERFPRASRLAARLHRLTPAVVIFGITLSSLHHTSLGSLFLVTPVRLHPLWYSTWLPVLFITSAMGAGMMVTVAVWMAWAKLFDPAPVFGRQPDRWQPHTGDRPPSHHDHEPRDLPMLRMLASIAAGVLGVYAVLKLVDLTRTGAWRFVADGSWESWLYVGELALTGGVPLALMLIPKVRRSPAGIAGAAVCAALGMTLNRLAVGIFGYFHDAEQVYLPSLLEWAVSLGIVAAAGLVLLGFGEHLAIFGESARARRSVDPLAYSKVGRRLGLTAGNIGSRVERVLLIAVFVVPVAWVSLYPPFHGSAAPPVQTVEPPKSPDPERAVLAIDANRSGLKVRFPHAEHRERAEKDGGCGRCHHLSLPGDNATPCTRCHGRVWSETRIFDHDAHLDQVAAKEELEGPLPGNRSCRFCHPAGRAHRARDAKACAECHEQDMKPAEEPESPREWCVACGYLPAVHRTCLPCHEDEAVERERPKLGECTNCHPGVRDDRKPPARLTAAAASPHGRKRR